jgi:hypothetical protein
MTEIVELPRMTELRTALLDLLHELKGTEIQKLIIGGGFGIYLKTEHMIQLKRKLNIRTLINNDNGNEWPESHVTNDLDLFLRPEILIQSEKLKPLAAAMDKLKYRPVPGAENLQFIKPGPGGGKAGSVKIDLLTGPQSRFEGTGVKTDDRRVHPNLSVGLHAHPVDDAPTLGAGLLPAVLSGKLGTGENWQAEIFLPHPYTFLMMKLFAFRDRLEDKDKEYGRYHALDLYSILATSAEAEWRQALKFRDELREEPHVKEASVLASKYFSALDRLGMIRLRESRYYRPELQLDDFMSALQELFPAGG